MNCLFLSPVREGWGRAETWMLHLAVGLQARGDSCAILADPRSRWPGLCREEGLEFIPFSLRNGALLRNGLRLQAIFRERRTDAVIVRGFRGARWSRWAGPGVAVLLKLPALRDLTDRLADRLTFRYGADRVLVDSYAVRDHYRRFPWVPVGKICAVHPGIPVQGDFPDVARRRAARAKLALPEGSIAIGVAAPLRARSHVMDAVEIFTQAAPGPDCRLLIFGEGPMQTELKRRSIRQGLSDRVIFTGWRSDAAELMWGLDMYLHTSVEEGLPRAMLEAMAAGVCVLADRAGGASEILHDGVDGFLIPAGDLTAHAARLREVAADPALRARIGSAAALRIRSEFTLDAMVGRIQDVLEQTIATRRLLRRRVKSVRTSDGWHWIARPDFDLQKQGTVPIGARTESGSPARLETEPQTSFRAQRCRKLFRLAHRLALLDTETRPHLAAGWRRGVWGHREAVLITGSVAGAVSAEEWLAAHKNEWVERRRFLSRFAIWLGRRHATGIVPHGLQMSTLFVRETEGDLHFILGDVQQCTLRWKPTLREIASQMIDLLRSMERDLSRADLLRFATDYRRIRHLHRSVLRRLLVKMDRPDAIQGGSVASRFS